MGVNPNPPCVCLWQGLTLPNKNCVVKLLKFMQHHENVKQIWTANQVDQVKSGFVTFQRNSYIFLNVQKIKLNLMGKTSG